MNTTVNNLTAEATTEITKMIAKTGLNHYTVEDFAADAHTYIKAIKERRMICVLKSVSSSGMSRVLSFHSTETSTNRDNETSYHVRQYNCLFLVLGFKENKSKTGFTISGCGMDMIFHTNYTIIHRLHRLNIITRAECDVLCQQTPVVL